MSDQPLLQLDDVSKFYGSITALSDVTTSVAAGEVTCVLGDNGAGKSTFIKILAGVHQQSEGTIRLAGEEVILTPRVTHSPAVSPLCTRTWQWYR